MSGTNDIDVNNISTGGPVEGACCFTNFNSTYTLPTSASASLGAGFESLGDISGRGYSENFDIKTNDFEDWFGRNVKSKMQSSKGTMKTEFIETVRATVAKLRYGDDKVTVSGGKVSKIEGGMVPERELPLIFDELMDDGTLKRTVFPRATIKTLDEVPHTKGNLLTYGMTFSLAFDNAGNDRYIYYATPSGTTGATGSTN